MAARRNLQHSLLVRERIKTSNLVTRLTRHALGEIEMTASQVHAALGLLRKTLPDLRQVEVTGPGGGPLQVEDARARNLALIDELADRAAGAAVSA